MLTDAHRWVLRDFPTLVWYCGPDDPEVAWVNETWLRFTGRTLEQERGMGFLEGVHPDDRDEIVAVYLDHYARREPYEHEYRMRRHDGEYRWLFELGRPLTDDDGVFAGYFGACYDITDRREAVADLEASEAMNSLLVQTIFHDLTSPLGAAVAAVDLLRSRVGEDGEAGRILGLLDEQLDNMHQLLVALRHLDQAEHGEDGRAVDTDLAEVLGDLIEGLDLGDRTLDRHLDSVPCRIDTVLLCRAVDNLLRNAVQHTPEGTTIRVRTGLVEGRPSIIVEDDGPGLPDDPRTLFEPYHRGSDRGEGSVGLGLSIAHRFVAAIDGELTGAQRPGGGARFVIALPAAATVRNGSG